jgi:hypothetical protein
MLGDYTWTLWILIPLSVPVMGILYLAACALADRNEPFLPCLAYGTVTFYVSLGVGWLIYSSMAPPVTNFNQFGATNWAAVGLALLASWGIGTVVYSQFGATNWVAVGLAALFASSGIRHGEIPTTAYRGSVLKGTQVAILEVGLRVLLAALITAVAAVVAGASQIARDPAQKEALLVGLGIVGGVTLVLAVLILGAGQLRGRLR